jgi:hypothetical protein
MRALASSVKQNIKSPDTFKNPSGLGQTLWELFKTNELAARHFMDTCECLAIVFRVDPATLWTVDLLKRRTIRANPDPRILKRQLSKRARRLAADAWRRTNGRNGQLDYRSLDIEDPLAKRELEHTAVKAAQAASEQPDTAPLERMAALVLGAPEKFPVTAAKLKLAGKELQIPIQQQVAAYLGRNQSNISRASKAEFYALKKLVALDL